jgi:hypothetical protein
MEKGCSWLPVTAFDLANPCASGSLTSRPPFSQLLTPERNNKPSSIRATVRKFLGVRIGIAVESDILILTVRGRNPFLMLIFAFLDSWALLPGRLVLDEAVPIAPDTSHVVADDLIDRDLVIPAIRLERQPDRGSPPADAWALRACEQVCEEGGVPSHSPADPPWLRPIESRLSPHLERTSRSVLALKPLPSCAAERLLPPCLGLFRPGR